MKVSLQDNQSYMLRFDKGEEVIAGLMEFLKAQNFTAASFSGIGSAGQVELGYYNPHLKVYRKKPFFEDMEIISFQGNGGIVAGAPAIHAHGMFGRTDFTTFGGHVFKLVTLATCEIFLIHLDGALERKNNPEFNLDLLT